MVVVTQFYACFYIISCPSIQFSCNINVGYFTHLFGQFQNVAYQRTCHSLAKNSMGTLFYTLACTPSCTSTQFGHFLLFLLFLPNINMQYEKICTPDDKFQGDTFTHSHTFPNVSNILGYFSRFSPTPTNWRPPSSTLQELERGAPGRPDILERSKYLLNQENMPDFSEHIIWPEHSSLHACTLCACMQGPISQPNWVGSERSKYLWNQDNIPDLSEHISQPKHTS